MSAELQSPQPPRLLGMFAHPDDESFCAGGTFARYVAAGAEAMVVSATRGEAGQIRSAALATRRTLGAVRERELQAACDELGVQHAHCLDYHDGRLKDVDPHELTGAVVRILRSFRPAVVITFGTDGAYGHPDHIAISEATTRACALAGASDAYPEQIAAGLLPFAPPRLYYSHFPRSRLRLIDWLVPWQMSFKERYKGGLEFVHALSLFAEESKMLRYADDHVEVQWYPPGCSIVEQGEPATSLYLIVSGNANAVREDDGGNMQVLETLTAGQFFGEIGLATGKGRNAHVIAVDHVTCMVFSLGSPTAFAGRGEEARFAVSADEPSTDDLAGATTCIDSSEYVLLKVNAIAAHRTQYPISADMFSPEMWRAVFGKEYFLRVLPKPEMETSLLP